MCWCSWAQGRGGAGQCRWGVGPGRQGEAQGGASRLPCRTSLEAARSPAAPPLSGAAADGRSPGPGRTAVVVSASPWVVGAQPHAVAARCDVLQRRGRDGAALCHLNLWRGVGGVARTGDGPLGDGGGTRLHASRVVLRATSPQCRGTATVARGMHTRMQTVCPGWRRCLCLHAARRVLAARAQPHGMRACARRAAPHAAAGAVRPAAATAEVPVPHRVFLARPVIHHCECAAPAPGSRAHRLISLGAVPLDLRLQAGAGKLLAQHLHAR